MYFGFIQLGIIFDQTLNLVIVFSYFDVKKGCNKKRVVFITLVKHGKYILRVILILRTQKIWGGNSKFDILYSKVSVVM